MIIPNKDQASKRLYNSSDREFKMSALQRKSSLPIFNRRYLEREFNNRIQRLERAKKIGSLRKLPLNTQKETKFDVYDLPEVTSYESRQACRTVNIPTPELIEEKSRDESRTPSAHDSGNSPKAVVLPEELYTTQYALPGSPTRRSFGSSEE